MFAKHKERETYEIPGGHREKGETVEFAARRELMEETGAIEYSIQPVTVYSVIRKTQEENAESKSFGMLYYAEIKKPGK